jgi:hypothetical protein
MLDVEDPYLGYDAEKSPYKPSQRKMRSISRAGLLGGLCGNISIFSIVRRLRREAVGTRASEGLSCAPSGAQADSGYLPGGAPRRVASGAAAVGCYVSLRVVGGRRVPDPPDTGTAVSLGGWWSHAAPW